MELIVFISVAVLAAVFILFPFLMLRRRKINGLVNKCAAKNSFKQAMHEDRSFSPFTFSLKQSPHQDVVFAEVIDSPVSNSDKEAAVKTLDSN